MTHDELRASTSATVTVTETASVLGGLDTRTVLRGVELGQLPAVRVGRRVLILREPLLAMLRAEPAPESPGEVSRPVSRAASGDPEATTALRIRAFGADAAGDQTSPLGGNREAP